MKKRKLVSLIIALEEILPCELVPVMGLIEELREVKDEEEVAIIEKRVPSRIKDLPLS